MTLQTGERVLGRYIVDGILGRGGMGEVYKGHHDRLGLPVALKILTDRSSELEKRFEREARLMARVRHPNIVAIMDFGTTDGGFPCIAMEFIEGEDLSHQLKRRQAMPWPRANQIFAGIVAGLGAMHAAEVLHRDLKPGNIVVAPGPPEVVRIIDFGIARPTGGGHETQLTNTGMVVGTPAYMSPEQMLGVPLDARSDLYSAGLIWFELLTGRGPSAGKSVADMLRRLQEPAGGGLARGDAPGAVRAGDGDVVCLHGDGGGDRRLMAGGTANGVAPDPRTACHGEGVMPPTLWGP